MLKVKAIIFETNLHQSVAIIIVCQIASHFDTPTYINTHLLFGNLLSLCILEIQIVHLIVHTNGRSIHACILKTSTSWYTCVGSLVFVHNIVSSGTMGPLENDAELIITIVCQ
jgi:hypothetical protein